MLKVAPYVVGPEPGVVVEEIYRSGTLAAIGRFYDKTGPVFVSFAFRIAVDIPFGINVFSKYRLNVVYVLCCNSDWYQFVDSPALAEAVREATRGFERIILYGASMGAYAALMFSGPMGADIVLAMSPQASLDPDKVPFEKRWLETALEIKSRNGYVFDDLDKYLTRTGQVIIVYDPNDDDSKHVSVVQTVRDIETVIIPFSHHRSLMCLSEMGLASKVLVETSKGTLNGPSLRQKIRLLRRRSATYCRYFGRFLTSQKAPGALAMLEVAAALTKPSDLEGLTSNFRAIAREAGFAASLPHLLRLLDYPDYFGSDESLRDFIHFSPTIHEAGAVASFTEALNRATAFAGVAGLNALMALAWLDAHSDNGDRAVERIQSLEARDTEGRLALEAAKLFRHLGHKQHAERQGRRAHEKSPSLDTLYFLADHLEREGIPSEAAELYRKHDQEAVLPAKPYRFRFASALSGTGKIDEAFEQLSKILAEDPSYAAAYRLQADLFARTNRYEDASESLKRALALNPRDVGILSLFALAAARAKRFEEAREAATSAIQLDSRRVNLAQQVAQIVSELSETVP